MNQTAMSPRFISFFRSCFVCYLGRLKVRLVRGTKPGHEEIPIGSDISRAALRGATAAGLALFAPVLMAAEWYGDEYAQCREGTTAEIVQCLDRQTVRWQARLDNFYDKLLAAQDTPERKAALAEAQRRWEAYRQASCVFYRQRLGSIAAIDAAECMRVLTKRRARELEQRLQP